MDTNAEIEIPEILFKYRDLSGENREYVRQTIVDSTVWFSSPEDFNDPFDCKVHLSFNGNGENWASLLPGLLERNAPHLTPEQRQATIEQVLTENKHACPQVLNRIRGYVQDRVNKFGVFCLSECYDDLLMWSYYANRHTGLCLGFANGVSPFRLTFPVDYCAEFPKVDYFADDDVRQWQANLLTKASSWRHEREWRVIDPSSGRGVRAFPPNLLVAVILGARMCQEDRMEILSWIERRNQRPALLEARLKEGFYGLEFHPVTEQSVLEVAT